jgi:dGTP triphosphohydrolase
MAGTSSLPRTICDYIAGMTDGFILQQHRKLLG